MKTSIATVSLSGSLVEKIQAIANAGYDGLEIFENDLIAAPQSAREVAAILKDVGLDCAMFQPFRDLEGMPDPQRGQAFDRMARKFDLMAALGTDLILLCSNCSPLAVNDRARMIDDLSALGELAARHNMRVGYEALAWGRHVDDHRAAWSLVRDVDHPNIGLVLDSFHSLARNIPVSSIGDIKADKLFFVQLADAPMAEMDPLSWSRHLRSLPGQGDFRLVDFMSSVTRTGYDGYWSLEIFNDSFRAGSASSIAVDGLRSLRFLEDEVRRNMRASATLPPRVKTGGVEFLEFSVGEEDAVAFSKVFSALGFTEVSKHRSKQVTRWKQGNINLVMNCEPEGFANSYHVSHGGSVCAIGLAVDDQKRAIERAEKLGIKQYCQPIGPGEWDIPSVQGVGGSLLYLVDSTTREQMWAEEFPIALENAGESGSLERVDHVAQTMQYAEFQTWLLYYITLLEVDKTQQLEIPDPKGLVYSQALENQDKSLRFTLNGSLAPGSLAYRFLENFLGAGVQHVAFSTRDIFNAAKSAQAAGLNFLEIGPNYYEDIEARFGLDAGLVREMARLNILYDRDEEAEYFQFYSRAITKRLFFEIVERRGYEAYGAANAQIRLNAQAAFREQEKPEDCL